MRLLKQQLIDLLKIYGPSGKEGKVRDYLVKALSGLVDSYQIDHYGNLLAEKKVGTGEGDTILLSAHMDTVKNVQKGRRIIEKDGVFYSTKGVLGADDRAGIAIILAVLRNIDKVSFNGTLKIAFTREEEMGCVGASYIDPEWYKDAKLAIVVDRRGSRDIVVGNCEAFCSDDVGKFFEECSAMLGMDWKATPGGVSDALIFSGAGINSVNLSAGYFNEHTEKEEVHLTYMRDTINLILQALALVNHFTFGEVPVYNKWIKDYGRSFKYNYGYPYVDDLYDDYNVLYKGLDNTGQVTVEKVGRKVYITKKGLDWMDEVVLDYDTFLDMCENVFFQIDYMRQEEIV